MLTLSCFVISAIINALKLPIPNKWFIDSYVFLPVIRIYCCQMDSDLGYDLFLESSVLPSDGWGLYPIHVCISQVPWYAASAQYIFADWLIWRGSSMFLYIYLASHINSRYQKVTNVTATLPYLTFALKWTHFLKLKNLWPKPHSFIIIFKSLLCAWQYGDH